MRILEDGIFLYHGSYCEISTIDLTFSRRALDFGKGFYLTSSYQQAVSYIPSAVKKNIRRRKLPADFKVEDGRLSIFRFRPSSELTLHYFPTADLDWLHFTISQLLPERLTDQFCFRTPKSLMSLEFVRSERYGDIL